LAGAVPHRAEFRKLRIEPTFLFFKAKYGCVNDLVCETWNCHVQNCLAMRTQ
jgi:hypothetical protein